MALATLVGCGNPPPYIGPDDPVSDSSNPPLVVTEAGTRGGQLVFVSENGERMSDLTKPGTVEISDGYPAWSPDGDWIVFASTRGRADLLRTSLWVVRAEPGSVPHRITFTSGNEVDHAPAWSADGRAIVFSSNRSDVGSFDLWRLDMKMGEGDFPIGDGMPIPLTNTPGVLEMSASPGKGGRIAYMRTDDVGTQLWTITLDGEHPTKLTDGPADLTPAWSPDGARIAYATVVDGRTDTDLFIIDADGGNRRQLADEPVGHESGPEWTSDGNCVFATALYRAEKDGSPVLSSLVVVDLGESVPVVRALHDPVSVQSRISVAVDPRSQCSAVLRRNAVYEHAIEAVVRDEFLRRLNDGEVDDSGEASP
jgi:Tol biopolymer transport system component